MVTTGSISGMVKLIEIEKMLRTLSGNITATTVNHMGGMTISPNFYQNSVLVWKLLGQIKSFSTAALATNSSGILTIWRNGYGLPRNPPDGAIKGEWDVSGEQVTIRITYIRDHNGVLRQLWNATSSSIYVYTPWTPAEETESGLTPRSWYKPESLSALTDGDAVVTWPDSAGSHDITQGTAGYRPLYRTNMKFNNPVVRFLGGSRYLRGTTNFGITGNQNRTIFMARRHDPQSDASNTVFSMGNTTVNGGNVGITVAKGATELPQMNVWVHNLSTVVNPYYSENWIVHKVSNNGNNVVESVNGVETTNQSVALATVDAPLCLGRFWTGSAFAGSYCFSGDVGEILIYDGFITGEDETQIIEYLMNKWVINPISLWIPERLHYLWEVWSSVRSGVLAPLGSMSTGCDVANTLVLAGSTVVTTEGISFPDVTATAKTSVDTHPAGSGLTVSAWIKPAEWVAGDNYIIDRWMGGGSNHTQFSFFISEAEGYKLAATLKVGANTYNVLSNDAIPLNEYTHVVLRWNGSVLSLYINGATNGTAVATTGVQTAYTRKTFVGCRAQTTSTTATVDNKWRGLIDNIYMWFGIGLSNQEILAMYNDDPHNPTT